jgi:hypothetical protein
VVKEGSTGWRHRCPQTLVHRWFDGQCNCILANRCNKGELQDVPFGSLTTKLVLNNRQASLIVNRPLSSSTAYLDFMAELSLAPASWRDTLSATLTMLSSVLGQAGCLRSPFEFHPSRDDRKDRNELGHHIDFDWHACGGYRAITRNRT